MWTLVHDLLSHRHAADIAGSLSDDAFKEQEQLLFDARNFFLNLVCISFAINTINMFQFEVTGDNFLLKCTSKKLFRYVIVMFLMFYRFKDRPFQRVLW